MQCRLASLEHLPGSADSTVGGEERPIAAALYPVLSPALPFAICYAALDPALWPALAQPLLVDPHAACHCSACILACYETAAEHHCHWIAGQQHQA